MIYEAPFNHDARIQHVDSFFLWGANKARVGRQIGRRIVSAVSAAHIGRGPSAKNTNLSLKLAVRGNYNGARATISQLGPAYEFS